MEEKGYSLMFCPKGEKGDVLRRAESIRAYDSAYDLLGNECDPALLEWMTEDFLDFLRHVDDWEGLGYYCLNGEYVLVCDSCNGDVLSFCTVSALLDYTVARYDEERED